MNGIKKSEDYNCRICEYYSPPKKRKEDFSQICSPQGKCYSKKQIASYRKIYNNQNIKGVLVYPHSDCEFFLAKKEEQDKERNAKHSMAATSRAAN